MPAVERRVCPAEFQTRLTRAVGTNQYGEPLWKIAWGQTETFTAGGVWPHDHFFGYRQLMMSNGSPEGKGTPCWMILEWKPADSYGGAAEYAFDNRDELTGLQTLGEYPYRGRYEVAYKLTSTELRNGRLEIVHYQLDGFVLDWLIPLLLIAQKMTRKERMELAAQATAEDEKSFDRNYEALRRDAKLSRAHNTQRVLDRELLIRRQMNEFLKTYGRPRPGVQQGKFAR